MIFNQEQIKLYLPHRDPFLFVNKVLEIHLPNDVSSRKPSQRQSKDLIGGTVICEASILKSHPIFAGHFPLNPVLPGVIQVEMVAQASSFLFTSLKEEEVGQYAIDVALLGIEKTRFKHVIKPDVVLKLEAKLIRMRNWLMVFEGNIFDKDVLCCQTEFMAKIDFK